MEAYNVERVQSQFRTNTTIVTRGSQGRFADRLDPLVRRTIWVAFVLAIANGVFLYFVPWMAETDYAWAIKPPVNAAFMGAGYLSGVLATGLALFSARYWRSIWGLMWPFFAIGLVELLATVLHADRFRWDYWLTWVWTGVYIIIPPAVAVLWVMQQRKSNKVPPLDARIVPLKSVSLALGAVVTLFGAALFLAPESIIPQWPWQLTPLLARAFSAWYLQMGVTLLFAGATLRQPHEGLIPYSWLAAINALILLLPALYSPSIFADRSGTVVWLMLHAAILGVGAWGTWRSGVLMKAEGQRL